MAGIIQQVARVVGATPTGRKIVATTFPGAIAPMVSRAVLPTRVTQPAPPREQPTFPIHLYAEVQVAAGAEATMRSQALTNRTGKPLEIRELRFGALSDGVAAGTANYIDMGGVIRVSMKVDGKPITNGYVPVWSLCQTEDFDAQFQSILGGLTDFGPWSQYVWRLSRPWYLKPGAVVEAQIQHTGAGKFGALAQVGLAGRTAPKNSPTSAVPYACVWASQPVKDSDTSLQESLETDLLNITSRNVMVDRIIARIASRYTVQIGGTPYLVYLDRPGWATEYEGLLLRLSTSDHRVITQDALGVAETFGPRRALEIAQPFAAGDFYKAAMLKPSTFNSTVNDYYAQAFVSAVGWREEPV